MTAVGAGAMRREDLALFLRLARGEGPVTVVSSAALPVWLRALPRLQGVVDPEAAAGLPDCAVGTIVVPMVADLVRQDRLAALRRCAAEVVHRHGSGWRVLPNAPVAAARPWRDWLLRAVPRLAGRFGVLRLRPPFRHDGGACWWASLAALRLPEAGSGQRIVLFEDGQPLPLADCVHDDIRQHGGGRYCVWERGVYFSATDGSDPRSNGRSYEVRVLVPGHDGVLGAPAGREDDFAHAFERFAAARAATATSPRRVLLLISSLGPGGAERQFCNLGKGLAARGLEVGLGSLDGFAGAAGHYLSLLHGSPVQPLDLSGADAAFDPAALAARVPGALELLQGLPDLFGADVWRVATRIATFRPDVLHCALDKTNLVGAVAGVATGVPRIVLSMRNVNPTHFPYLDLPWFHRWYSLAAEVPGLALSANSQAGGEDYAAWLGLPPSRVHTVRNGFDAEAVRVPDAAEVEALRAGLGIGPDDPVLAGVFRLSPEKRPLLWLEVVAALRRRFPRLRALHVGHGPDHDAVLQHVRGLGLQDAVHLLGRRPDPFAVLRAADLLLLVSTFEGIPNVALEAQWLERPVVCTAAGGSVEAVQDGVSGYVVAEPTVASLAGACERILADRALQRRLGAGGRDLVASRFRVDRMVDESLALYR